MIALSIALSATFVLQDVRNDYEPNWESLETHPTPKWFEDGKFGIFIHWGVYSVPAFCDTSTYSEWYQCWLDNNSHNGLERTFHEKNYGADFKYREFAPMFRAEMWDPAEWARIFKRAGAEYVVLTSKHHDGFALWPSEEASDARGYPWNAVETGPKRDLIDELFTALRKEGVRPGLYYSFMEWHNPLYDNDKPRYVEEVMVPHIKDLITRYEPDVFWPDGEWDLPDTLWRSTEILDWMYDNCANPDSFVVNDRWGKGLRGQVGDYTTTEYDNLGNSSGKEMRKYRPFEECRGVGHSFAFNRAENYDIYDSREASVRKLIDLVSKGGVLLLDVGPTADGRIPLIMVDRLLAIGDWLKVNGESIKGADQSPFTTTPWGRATAKGNVVYLHVYDWPEGDALEIPGLVTPITSASMLGDRVAGRTLEVDSTGLWQTIDLSGLHPFEHATVIRCELEGEPVIDDALPARADGVLELPASSASLEGPNIRIEHLANADGVMVPSIGYWTLPEATASWTVRAPAGWYTLSIDQAIQTGSEGSRLDVLVNGVATTVVFATPTGGWSSFENLDAGEIKLPASSEAITISLHPVSIPGAALVNIRSITLKPKE